VVIAVSQCHSVFFATVTQTTTRLLQRADLKVMIIIVWFVLCMYTVEILQFSVYNLILRFN